MQSPINVVEMRIVGFIPIKTNNQRTPGKNTRRLSDGTPICNLIFNTMLQVSEIDDVYCFCSDDEIKNYIPSGITLIKRSPNLDSPETTGNDLIEAFMKSVDADIYVQAHVTAPFLASNTISECINAVLSGRYDSSTTVCALRDFIWDDSGPINYDPSDIVRTQDLPNLYRGDIPLNRHSVHRSQKEHSTASELSG